MAAVSNSFPRFLANGDTALAVEFGQSIDRAVAGRVVALARALNEESIDGVVETVPTYRSLLIHFDPDIVSAEQIEDRAQRMLHDLAEQTGPSRCWTIPACYDEAVAPDLQVVAEHAGLTGAQVAECHAGETYFVYMMGFLPGYPYLGDVPAPLVLPRRTNPRTRVPAGSLAIAQTMTAVYTLESPGGWHLIGRTPVPFFDARNDPPALLAPGDLVRFEPVSLDEIGRIEDQIHSDSYRLDCQEVVP